MEKSIEQIFTELDGLLEKLPVPRPEPTMRRISSDPPRVGRLAAFADGRRAGRGRRRPQKG